MVKPNIFIGSSTESLEVAYSLQENLEPSAEVTVWTQGCSKNHLWIIRAALLITGDVKYNGANGVMLCLFVIGVFALSATTQCLQIIK
jgi:hypothetical protein